MKNLMVVGTDGSAGAVAALRWAASEARLRDVPLKIVHASRLLEPSPDFSSEAQEAILKDKQQILVVARADLLHRYPGLEVEIELLADQPGAALVALSEKVQLLVVGARGADGFNGLLLGSVSLHTAAYARCPVVVMPHEADHDAEGPVLVGIDEAHANSGALAFAFAEADRRHVPLIALHVIGGIGAPGQRLGEDMELSEALAGWTSKYPDLKVIKRVAEGHTARSIIDASREGSLVVVGARRRGHLIGMALGPVNHAVLHHSHAPIAVVPDH